MRYFFILLLLVSFRSLATEKVPVKIYIQDQLTGAPLEGATLRAAEIQGIANAKGVIEVPLSGPTEAVVSATGYKQVTVVLLPHKSNETIQLLPESGNLNEVVVSASLRPVTRLSSPVPVESYQSRYFRRNPTPNLFDALAMVNGVQSQVTCNVCNTGEIRINGLDGPYTMVLIDGMPIVSSLSTVYGLSGIPNSMVKRIEIVKGPASTLYGSEAMAGLINIITVDPLSSHKLSADMHFTTYAEWNTDISAKLNAGKAKGLLGINFFNFTHPVDRNNDGFTDITLQQRVSAFNKWTFERKSNLPASVALRLLSEKRWGGEMNWNESFTGSDSIYGEHINTRRIELVGQYGLSKSILAEYSYNHHFQDSWYGTMHYKGRQHTAFAQLRWSGNIGNHRLSAGLPFRLVHYDDNTTATRSSNFANAPSLQTMAGLFVQDEISLHNRLTLLAGLRLEHSNLQGLVASPRLAAKWQASKAHSFRLSGGNGFRIVNLFTEDHAALSGFREVVIKNTLKPERSWNLTANYAGVINAGKGLLNMDVSLFTTWFSNRILPDYDSDPHLIIYDNLDGKAISRGASATLDYVLPNGVRAGMGITHLDVFVHEKGPDGIAQKSRQVYVPQWSGNYSLGIPVKKWGTTVDLTGTFLGPMRLPVFPNDFRSAFSPWYTLLNLQVTKRFNHTELYVSGKNLLNFMPANPILHPDDPFDKPGGRYWRSDGTPNPVTNPNGFSFDPTYNYAPMQGIRLLIGCRIALH